LAGGEVEVCFEVEDGGVGDVDAGWGVSSRVLGGWNDDIYGKPKLSSILLFAIKS